MTSPSKPQKTLSPLNTHWHNRSLSSIASDAATFHSALAHTSHMELTHMSSVQDTGAPRTSSSIRRPTSPQKSTFPSPKLESFKMSRQDSGYEDGTGSTSNSRRTSTSSSSHRLKFPTKHTKTSSSTRPSTKRACRSSTTTTQALRTSTSSGRPSLHTRQNTAPYTQTIQPYQFFQFPTLVDPEAVAAPPTPPTPPPPPATCQYWTSDSTRRLEYAAIDAASRGVRGFFIKLVPDCILPPSSRRTKFHCDDAESDAGSVRRYRLALPEEKVAKSTIQMRSENSRSRPSGFRRWTTSLGFGRRTSN